MHLWSSPQPLPLLAKLSLTLLLLNAVDARHCFDDVKGACRVDDRTGWCLHNRSSGELSCDSGGFCASVKLIQGQSNIEGCFAVQPSNQQVCCCNKGNGCNIRFLKRSPKSNFQRCVHSEEPSSAPRPVHHRNCDDNWCYALTVTSPDGASVTTRRGCHSSERVAYETSRDEYQLYGNNTQWREMEQLANMPLCSDIAWDVDDSSDAAFACYEYSTTNSAGESETARLCCCRGRDHCNRQLPKEPPTVDLSKVKENRRRRVGATASVERGEGGEEETAAGQITLSQSPSGHLPSSATLSFFSPLIILAIPFRLHQ